MHLELGIEEVTRDVEDREYTWRGDITPNLYNYNIAITSVL